MYIYIYYHYTIMIRQQEVQRRPALPRSRDAAEVLHNII